MTIKITHQSNPMADTCRAVLAERFGLSDADELISFERHQAYELCKKKAWQTARNCSDYKQKCQQIARFLAI